MKQVISTRVPESIGEKLRLKASRERRTVGQVLRILVEDYFDQPIFRRTDATVNAKRKTK